MAYYGRGEDESALEGEELPIGIVRARPTREQLLRVPAPPAPDPFDALLRAAEPPRQSAGTPRPPAAVERAFAIAKGVPIGPGVEAKIDFGRRMLKLVRKF